MLSFSNTDLLSLIIKRWKHVAIIVGAALMGAFVVSSEWIIKPRYKSMAVVYPVNIIPYSDESPTEQLLQLFQSADVRGMMIKRFRLAEHYNVDTTARAGKSKLYLTISENIDIRKTEYESVKIEIYDVNPDTACSMVNALIHFVDIKARALQREKTQEVVNIFQDQLNHKKEQLDSLEKVLNMLRVRYGLLDYKSQAKEVTKSYLKIVGDGGSGQRLVVVDSLMRNLEQKGGELLTASEQLKSTLDVYNAIQVDYDRALSDLKKELTYTNVITRPLPADQKSYPIRWLIMVITGISSVLVAIFVIVILEGRSNFLANARNHQQE
jgi:capsular polysaccharide biosynthesis protein